MVNGNTTTKTITIYISSDAAMNGFYYGRGNPNAENAILTLREEERSIWLADRPTPPNYWHQKYEDEARLQRGFAALCAMIRKADQQGNVVWLTGNDYDACNQLNQHLVAKGLPEVYSGRNGLQFAVRYGLFTLTDAVRDLGLPYKVFNYLRVDN